MDTAKGWAWLESGRWESKGYLILKAVMTEGGIKEVRFLILLNDFRSSVTAVAIRSQAGKKCHCDKSSFRKITLAFL